LSLLLFCDIPSTDSVTRYFLRSELLARFEKAPSFIGISSKIESGKFEFVDVEPVEFARQLTLVDSELFTAIEPKECLSQCWNKAGKEQKATHLLLPAHSGIVGLLMRLHLFFQGAQHHEDDRALQHPQQLGRVRNHQAEGAQGSPARVEALCQGCPLPPSLPPSLLLTHSIVCLRRLRLPCVISTTSTAAWQ
jgi:hypothetical protein